MAYSVVNASELLVNKPLTSSLMTRINDNPLAIFAQLGYAVTAGFYESPEQTVTPAGLLTLNHGLTSEPSRVQPWAICKTGEFGYTAGDKVLLPMLHNTTGGQGYGYSVVLPSATSIELRIGSSGIGGYNHTTGAFALFTSGNWKIIVRAWG